jgi:cilia- and flagella-associated protein 298
MKPEELRGFKDYDEYVKNEDITTINGLKKMPPRVGVREVPEETHYRTGWLLSEEMTKMMLDEAMKAKLLIHKSKVDQKVCLTKQMMMDEFDIIRGLIMMAYPAYYGLGEWEPIKVILENREEFDEKMDLTDDLPADKSSVWVCGKELQAEKFFYDYFGKNEKSKYVVKVQKRGSGAPQREPMIDEKTHKEMMSYYYKKQEEQKKLEDDNEDAYMNSAWADTKQLKGSLHGQGNVKWKF